MNTLTVTGFNTVVASGQAHGIATFSGPRELTQEEIEMVSGGLPFVIAPIVVAGARLAGAAFVTTFGATLGAEAGAAVWSGISSVWGEEEAACR